MPLFEITRGTPAGKMFLNTQNVVAISEGENGTVINTTGIKGNTESGFVISAAERLTEVVSRFRAAEAKGKDRDKD